MSKIHHILKSNWGYDSFRPMQEDIILSILEGQDTLALLPTGGGKSICFQIPAMAKDGLCLVVSPLIALMKDQVENLQKRNIQAEAIYSGMPKYQIDRILDNCIYGDVKFLYVSPERLKTELFLERFRNMHIGLIAVDEAHCISQWGYDFRPAYLEIAHIRSLKPNVPCIALTASATEAVCQDIMEKLEFHDYKAFRKSFARENLSYSCFYSENKDKRSLKIITSVKGSKVVYVRNRQKTKSFAEYLQRNGISADYYHAGLDYDDRNRKQREWITSQTEVIVSTNAFGMGIDKPDVRMVLHLEPPPDLESYYQEAGRAGRDGNLSYAVLLYNHQDFEGLKASVQRQHPPYKLIKDIYQRLTEYYRLAEGSTTEEYQDFNLYTFSKKQNIKPGIAYPCIQKLENQNIIEFSEDLSPSSTIQILVDTNTFIQHQSRLKGLSSTMELLIRIYGGDIFDRDMTISEQRISHLLEENTEQVVKNLELLAEKALIRYNRSKKSAKIRFTVPVRKKNPPLNTDFLNTQRKRYELKLDAIINYTSNRHRCRTQMILEYFDEYTDVVCGNCDFCIDQKKERMLSDVMAPEEKIIQLLEGHQLDLEKLASHFDDRQAFSRTLRELMDAGKVRLMDGQYQLS